MAKGRASAQDLKRDPLMQQYVATSAWAKSNSRPLLKWLTVAAVVVAVVAIGWMLYSRRANNAAEELAEAFRWNDAIVANPVPANPQGYVATSEDDKHHKAYEAFTKAANDYPSFYGDLARYYAAVHQLYFEPEKAEATLKELSGKTSDVGQQAQMALAQRYEAAGKNEEAIAEYQKLKSKPGAVTALIDFNIARVYEAMGKKDEAVNLYFNIANNKDYRSTSLGTNCVNRLTVLAPEKVDQLPPAEQTNPFANLGGLGGMSIR
ncbi:MAG: tetratricopeptide repeat protein [Acidobacteria bacterium]|nr:tetratricopeptide repeat protein [Acidobacteriota bacterium]